MKTKTLSWHNKPQTVILYSLILFVILFCLLVLLKNLFEWPNEKSESTIIVVISIIGFSPFILYIINLLAKSGGKIAVGKFSLEFSDSNKDFNQGFEVPVNIGDRGLPIGDSRTNNIMDAIKSSIKSSIISDTVIIDLEDGKAWWETRLFILLSGLKNQNNQNKVIFIGKEEGQSRRFLGWAYSNQLFDLLINTHPQYKRLHQAAGVSAAQWNLVELAEPANAVKLPAWVSPNSLSQRHSWMAYDTQLGLHKPMYFEQLLASEIGQKIEQPDHDANQIRCITINRMEELFRTILITKRIDLNWKIEDQQKAFFSSSESHIVIVNKNEYKGISSQADILFSLVEKMAVNSYT